jgi:diaminopimelate decarboxylase
MHHFHYINQELHCERVPIAKIVREIGSPVYVYSRRTLEHHFRTFQESFKGLDHLVCYSMKACSNLTVLKIFAKMGGGVDIVSGGELYRALKAGVDPSRIVYSGVGKLASEIDRALAANILMFNVESEEELELLNRRATTARKTAQISLRVNPDVDAGTHPYISTGLRKNKFGIDIDRSKELYKRAARMKRINPVGVDCHIGSQLTELSPFLDAIDRLADLIKVLRDEGVDIRYLDIGGGLGIRYDAEEPPPPSAYGAAVISRVADMRVKLILEPGRVLVGNAGTLITKVLYRKATPDKHFVVVDAAMNDLIRPSLYKAHHSIWKVSDGKSDDKITADIVGPICESGDFLAQGREIDNVEPGELLAVMSAGAYGFTMSSNYNSRPRVPEALVDDDSYYVIRQRETYDDLIRGEVIPPHISD